MVLRMKMPRSITIVLVLLTALMPTLPAFAAGARPYFLVATPQMGDPIFGASVIMMIPTIDAPLLAGVIINKPTTTSPQEVFPHFPALKNGPNSAYFGGPVDNGQAIVALRTSHPPAKRGMSCPPTPRKSSTPTQHIYGASWSIKVSFRKSA